MSAQVVVGVDIGDDSIRAVEVTGIGKERPTVERYQEISLPEGAVKDGEVTEVNTVAAALRQLWASRRVPQQEGRARVGNTKVLVRDLTVPAAERRRRSGSRCLPMCRTCCRFRSRMRCSTSTRSRKAPPRAARSCTACWSPRSRMR